VLKAGNHGALGSFGTCKGILVNRGGQLDTVIHPLNYLWCLGRSGLNNDLAKFFFTKRIGRELSDDTNSRHGRGTEEERNSATQFCQSPHDVSSPELLMQCSLHRIWKKSARALTSANGCKDRQQQGAHFAFILARHIGHLVQTG